MGFLDKFDEAGHLIFGRGVDLSQFFGGVVVFKEGVDIEPFEPAIAYLGAGEFILYLPAVFEGKVVA